MAAYSLPQSDSISMSRGVVDRLIAGRNGGVTLAYLCLLQAGEVLPPEKLGARLGVPEQEASHMLSALAEMGLLVPAEQKREFTGEELTQAMRREDFKFLCNQVENLIGEPMTPQDLQRLLYMNESLGLPAEVLLQMFQYFKSETRRVYGPGRRLTMGRAEKLAADWKARGIMTLEAAEDHIRRRESYREQEGTIKRILEIYDRRLTAGEQKYVSSWIDMGFGTDAIRICYERTLDRIHAINFKYMDSIFISWHKKGLHTPEEIEAGDGVRQGGAAASAPASAGESRTAIPEEDETERLRRLTESMKKGK